MKINKKKRTITVEIPEVDPGDSCCSSDCPFCDINNNPWCSVRLTDRRGVKPGPKCPQYKEEKK
jgi:hypothetical protein